MNDIFWLIFEMIINITESLLIVAFPTIILGLSEKSKKCKIILAITFLAVSIILQFHELGIFQIPIIIIIMITYSYLTLKANFIEKLALIIIPILVISVTSMTVMFLFAWVGNLESMVAFEKTSQRIIMIIISKVLCISILSWIIILAKKNIKLNTEQWIYICINFTIPMFINSSISKYVSEISLEPKYQSIFFLISFAMLLVSILSFIMIAKLAHANKIDTENKLLKQEKIYSEKYVSAMRYNNDEISRIKHDYKKYMNIVKTLIENNKTNEAIKECHKLIGAMDKISTFIECDSILIGAVINEKINECKKNNIEIVCKIEKNISLSNESDFVVILMNLIDNAIEYCINIDSKYRTINLELTSKKGFVILKIENRILNSVFEVNPNLKSIKTDKKNHGIGISSVKHIINENNAVIKFNENKNFFVVDVVFPE